MLRPHFRFTLRLQDAVCEAGESMQRFVVMIGLGVFCACGLSGFVDARPLLQDSQQTYAGACLAAEEPPERLVLICEAAMEDGGSSPAQRREMKIELADALYSMDENERAQKVVDDILAEAPDSGRALTISGWIDWDADRNVEAMAHFEASIAVGPTAENLAGFASSARHAGDIEQDRFLLMMDAALAMSPKYTWALREKAWGLFDFGDAEAAEAVFREALALKEDSVWSLYGLGYVLNDMDRHDEALTYLNRAADRRDVPAGVYSQRSLARFYEGRYKLALKDANTFIEMRPKSGTGYVRRARALSAMGQRQIAIDELARRQEETHNDFIGYWLADLLTEEGEFEDALAALMPTFDKGSPDYFDMELRAMILLDLKRLDDAKVAIEEALSVRENANYPYFYRALILVQEGDLKGADAAMDIALDNGLPEHRVSKYLEALATEGAFLHAIQWRIGWRNKRDATSE